MEQSELNKTDQETKSRRSSYYMDDSPPADINTEIASQILHKKPRSFAPSSIYQSDGKNTLRLTAESEAKQLPYGSIHKIWCMVQLDATRKLSLDMGKKLPIDFIVAIDHSSSMRMNDKLAYVKATIQYFIEQLSDTHRFCLIEFNHEVNKVTDGLLEMNETNKKLVLENLKKITPEGSTNISDALITAINILKDRPGTESSRISSVMLFTGKAQRVLSITRFFPFSFSFNQNPSSAFLDGLANAGLRGQKLISEITSMQIPTGLTINTFGTRALSFLAFFVIRNLAVTDTKKKRLWC
jgi:hypothetical protein